MKTIELLMRENNNRATLTVEEVGTKYWGWTPAYSRRLAANGNFPVKAFRMSQSRKAPYQILLRDLADYLDTQSAQF